MTIHWDVIASLGTLMLAIAGFLWRALLKIRSNDMKHLHEEVKLLMLEQKATKELVLRLHTRMDKHLEFHMGTK